MICFKSVTHLLKSLFSVLVFDDIELYAPGFKSSVVGRDILTPPDLERIFGLTGGVSGLGDLFWLLYVDFVTLLLFCLVLYHFIFRLRTHRFKIAYPL